ncbi:regulatory protein, luxR family [Georgenia satyanarayanai]|uniref:Regulatory protein, luxR family n=1 Tax=Georgenia satyanarayanai TaxID=860221 RepID=A0A2Y9AQR2_9MICO|nr:LuxR family transcriptional regulator [Georgenia satyanarayanai]PYF98969.1 regulatory LuxR family protein [Georgenia satyanarayanai]SSA44817.1 regulatory protein, luxR family [Georgenia satyanarayanai]
MAGIVGRRAECDAVDHLLAGAHAGRSGALLIRGEAGIGKTALLEYARDTAASRLRVENAVGVESETQFAFAGLHQLCAPLLDHAGVLSEPQQTALDIAFGRQEGATPDRFLVGLAALHLLAEAAEEAPLLCLIDDAQWLDQASAQVLAFVARRVAAERMALVLALRDPTDGDVRPFAGLPELHLDGLSAGDARALLAAEVRAPLDVLVRDRIVAEARGNPLALLELPRSAPAHQLAGGFDVPEVLSVPRRVEESFRRRSATLPADTQRLLLLAAADPTGDVALLWRGAAHLGIAADEASLPAEAAGLLEIGSRVRFRHPLVRSAVYRAATAPDQRRAHGALAVATDSRSDPDRRAWHRARAVLGTDEAAAAELERSAGRVRAHGGLAAAAAFLQLAAELTPDPAARATRALEAAHAKHDAGASDAALELVSMAASGPLDALQRARLELLRARIAFHQTRGSDMPGMLLDVAKTLVPLDPALARETYLHALDAAIHAGYLARGRGLPEAAEAARDAPASPGQSRPVDLLLTGLATRYTQGFEESVPALQRALDMFVQREPGVEDDDRQWLWLACHVASMLWDDEALYVLAGRAVRLAREAGAMSTLPAALNAVASILVLTGELARSSELAAEEAAITQLTGAPPLPNARLMLSAWSGRRLETVDRYDAMVKEATERGEGGNVGLAQATLAALHNGLGNFAEGLAAAAPPCDHDDLAYSSLALPELVEAAVRAGEPERAAAAAEQLSSRARASGTDFALGLAARSRGLTTIGPAAEDHYREAIVRLTSCRWAVFLARTHLVYGEWLRRQGRRQDAGDQLRTAHQQLSDMGIEAYAERAARELRALGEHPRARTPGAASSLTPQEAQIARLVATGATSREVATQLFLSPRTIESHLRNIFRKLGITSRRQLDAAQLP